MVEVRKVKEVFHCQVCGNITEILTVGGGELICCGEPMERFEEKRKDKGLEKHIPVIEKKENGSYLLKVGETLHPMEDGHFIQWIEIIVDGEFYQRKFLKPGDVPEFEFFIGFDHEKIVAREYCNVHGLWTSNFKL